MFWEFQVPKHLKKRIYLFPVSAGDSYGSEVQGWIDNDRLMMGWTEKKWCFMKELREKNKSNVRQREESETGCRNRRGFGEKNGTEKYHLKRN